MANSKAQLPSASTARVRTSTDDDVVTKRVVVVWIATVELGPLGTVAAGGAVVVGMATGAADCRVHATSIKKARASVHSMAVACRLLGFERMSITLSEVTYAKDDVVRAGNRVARLCAQDVRTRRPGRFGE